MPLAFGLLFLLAGTALGDEAVDRVAVLKTIAALNEARATKDGRDTAILLAPDIAPEERARFLEFEGRLTAAARRPMSEIRMPFADAEGILFVTADVAVVDIKNSSGWGEVLVLKRFGVNWRFVALRAVFAL